MDSCLFQLPDELVLATLSQTFPHRTAQIRALATLLYPTAAPCQNLVLYGIEATGKSAITAELLAKLETDQVEDDKPSLKFAIVNSVECITTRHLFETVVGRVADALKWDHPPSKCETVSQLTVELSKMLKHTPRSASFRFVLVFDAIDHQREAPSTLLPALARLSEIIPCLTSVFIVTSPPAGFLRTSFAPHLHFPSYTKAEFVAILTASPPPTVANTTPAETAELWNRFVVYVHDTLARAAARTLPAIRHACAALWPRFTAPILAGTHGPREFSKLFIAVRLHFQDDRVLDPGIVSVPCSSTTVTVPNGSSSSSNDKPPASTDLTALLPTTARLLLLAAYLASHNATRHDLTLFSTHHHGRRRRRGGLSVSGIPGRRGGGPRSKHRKIARKLLGAHAFVLERMMAIFAAVRGEWEDRDRDSVAEQHEIDGADIGMAIATLASLRLLVRVGGAQTGGDPMDRGGKWRVNVGWEVVKGLGRSMGVEVEEWLIE